MARRRRCNSGIEIVFLLEFLAISSKHADAQAEIQRQVLLHMPVILKIWLEYFVAVVILRLQVGLREGGNISGEKVGKSVSGTNGGSCVEGRGIRRSEARLVDFVFLVGDES